MCSVQSPSFRPSLLFDYARPRHPYMMSGSSLMWRRHRKTNCSTKKGAGSRNYDLTSSPNCSLRSAVTNYKTTILIIDTHGWFVSWLETWRRGIVSYHPQVTPSCRRVIELLLACQYFPRWEMAWWSFVKMLQGNYKWHLTHGTSV